MVKCIAECSRGSILQYFWPALSENRSWKPILVFFLSGRLRQVLLYYQMHCSENENFSVKLYFTKEV